MISYPDKIQFIDRFHEVATLWGHSVSYHINNFTSNTFLKIGGIIITLLTRKIATSSEQQQKSMASRSVHSIKIRSHLIADTPISREQPGIYNKVQFSFVDIHIRQSSFPVIHTVGNTGIFCKICNGIRSDVVTSRIIYNAPLHLS